MELVYTLPGIYFLIYTLRVQYIGNRLYTFEYIRDTKITNEKMKANKHNAELQPPIPAQKIRGNSVPGAVLSHTMPKIDFYYSHRFSWKKNTH